MVAGLCIRNYFSGEHLSKMSGKELAVVGASIFAAGMIFREISGLVSLMLPVGAVTVGGYHLWHRAGSPSSTDVGKMAGNAIKNAKDGLSQGLQQ